MDGGRWYTAVVAGLAAGIMLATGSRWGKSTAVLAAVVTVLNLMCNGYLTARPVVVYNRVVISGVRVGTVPVEDLVYGWILVWGVVKVYEKSDKIK
jgi:lycopene cyclase domain-containing protein